MSVHYSTIKDCDIANGLGVRISLFVSGCRNHCKNCFNQCTWDFNYGKPVTRELAYDLSAGLSRSYIDGLTVLGGEPLEPENQWYVNQLVKFLKANNPTKNFWLYTGFTYEELHNPTCRAYDPRMDEILEPFDVLVDGRFIEEYKDISLRFRGSSNQKIIDLNKTREVGHPVLLKLD